MYNKANSKVKASSRIFAFSEQVKNCDLSLLPKTIEIHLSNICNNSCKFCFYQADRSLLDKITFLPTERIISLLSSFTKETDKSLVLSGGGEPTLHPHFSEIIDKAVDVGFDVGVITNGIHYNHKIEEALKKTKWVKFSLHAGDAKTYQNLMYNDNGVEIFNRVQNHIKSLVASKTPMTKISVGCVITQKNQSDCDILNYFDNATNNLHVDYVLFRGYMGSDPVLQITRKPEDFSHIEQIIALRSQEKDVFSNFSSFIRDYNITRNYLDGICPIVSSGMIAAITTDGNVHICLPTAQQKNVPSIGSILNESFHDIWNSDRHHAVLDELLIKNCPPCKYERMFPLIKKIKNNNCNLEQEIIKAKQDPHWRFL